MMREKIDFGGGWLFHRGDIKRAYTVRPLTTYVHNHTEREIWGPAAKNYNDSADSARTDVEACTENWESVTVPHDYTITELPSKENNADYGFYPLENAWYRKHFVLPDEDADKRIVLYFEGAGTKSTVWVNGCLAHRQFVGYTPFSVDITNYVSFKEKNVVAVYIDNADPEIWSYSGGGIYRPVWMIKTEKIAVDLYGVYVHPIKRTEHRWEVPVEVTVRNDSTRKAEAVVQMEVEDGSGSVVASAQGKAEVYPFRQTVISAAMEVDDPLLWDCEHPHLYTVHTTVLAEGKPMDEVNDRFGFRTIRFDPNEGFFLNGKHTLIKGVGVHNEDGMTGKAMPRRIQKYRLELLKEMGANGYRTAHYPHSDYTMDCLDEMGFLVMDETRWFSTNAESLAMLETLVKRDRNHPSVILWSIGNEEMITETDNGRRIAEQMRETVKRYDESRPVTMAVVHSMLNNYVLGELDVIGVNYNYKWYDEIHAKYPDKPIFVSEGMTAYTTRGWYHDSVPERGYFTAYDTQNLFPYEALHGGREKIWKSLMERPCFAGIYQWAAIEHRGEGMWWPRISYPAGVIDLYLQKKDAFYQHQSQWLDTPMIHVFPHWCFRGREGEEIAVWAYTNCEEAELFLNGVSVGRVAVEKYGHAEWKLPYTPGKLEAVGYVGGEKAADDVTETPGEAAALELRLEGAGVGADDWAILTCVCVDQDGREVYDASPFVSFYCNRYGRIAATGGAVTDHTPPRCPDRKLWMGRCSVLVKTGKTPGVLKVVAQADGLKPAVLSVDLSLCL